MARKSTFNQDGWTKQAYDWGRITSPERPSQYEIEIYEDYVRKISKRSKGKLKALILGATPELRDLLARYEIKTTLADINMNMIKAMSRLLEYSDGKEKVVMTNWLNMPFKSESFDIILCDQGIHHIPFEKWDKFFAEQARLLKKGGHLIKGIITVEKNEIADVSQMVNIYKNSIFTREDRYYYNYLCFFGLKDIKGKKHFKDLSDMNRQLEDLMKKGKINKKEGEFLKTPWGYFQVAMPVKDIVDESVSKYFMIKSVRNSFVNTVLTCYKIYFCQVKK